MDGIPHSFHRKITKPNSGRRRSRSLAALGIAAAFALAVTALTPAATYSQTFTAAVSNTTVGQNEQFDVSFTFSAQDVNGIKNFQPPDFRKFVILSGPNQSTSLQFINGAASGSMTYSYYLRCPKLGKFTIGSASLEYSGKKYTTNPIAIEVTKSTPQAASKGQPSVSTNDIGDNVFILATADKRRVYLGEQVTVTYKLYTRLPIASQMQVSKLPSYEGFWAEEITLPATISLSTEMHNGKEYRVGVLKKVALFPSQLGELSVTPMVLSIPVQIRQRQGGGGNVFDQFFNDPFFNNYRTVNFNARSNTIKLEVMPLPSRNVPASFNGAVGDYALSSDLSATDIKANEPLTLKVTLTGQGNLQLLSFPDFTLPSGFDKYEPKVSEQIDRSGTISGTKTFEYLIVPRVAGKKEIPSVEFSYFNPAKRSYIALSTPAYAITVEPGASNGNETAAGFSKENVKLLGEDIHYIRTSAGDLRRQVGLTVFGPEFWSAVFVPLFLLGGLITWKRRNDKLAGNLQLLRYRRAEKLARARFKKAKALMDAGNQTGFYAEISQALFGYLEDKLHIQKSEISLEKAEDELRKRNANGQLMASLRSCAEKCEFARFAPIGDGTAAMKDMYNELTNVIVGLERTISVKRNG